MDNPINIEDIFLKKLIEIFIEKSINFLSKSIRKEKMKLASSKELLENQLPIYVKKSLKFCENISVFKLNDKYNIDLKSIHLSIRDNDRRFTSDSGEIVSESQLLYDERNHILLGDPGAGKTTTIKRLVKKTFEILFSDDADGFKYSFPIVVKLGEIKSTETLFTHICEQVGIQYDAIPKSITYTEIEEFQIGNEIEYREVTKTRIIYEYKIGHLPLKYALGGYLEEMCCVIFFDGLDEVHFLIKDSVFEDIKQLSQVLSNSKIILTSRYIAETPSFKQFKSNKIIALDNIQKKEIANLWINNIDLFFQKLEKLPYKDISDRPLFLTYLLRLFEDNNDELPNQAIDVYRQIVLLAIREWDNDKESPIKRFSKYKKFDTYKKEDFLSALTFYLTYYLKVKKVFTHRELEQSYYEIYSKYSYLSINDHIDILRDIEAHNGLIIETFGNKFEFSHLSLQEYLCAKYLVSIPISRKHFEYFNIYPAPFAIANILTPQPQEWFTNLFLGHIGEINVNYQLKSEKIYEFIDRLMIEKIVFTKPTKELGIAVLYLFFKCYNSNAIVKLAQFSNVRHVQQSIKDCLYLYERKQVGNDYHFKLKKNLLSDMHIICPEKGIVRKNRLNMLI